MHFLLAFLIHSGIKAPMNLKTIVLAAATVALPGLNSEANSLLSFDFDGVNSDYKYGYTYSEFGSGSQDNGIFSATGGNGGTGGLVVSFDTTSMSGGWAGIGAGLGAWSPVGNYSPLVGLQSLADITFKVDGKAGGLTGASAGVTFELKFEAVDNTIVPNDSNTDTDVLLQLTSSRTLTSEFQTFTSTLDTWTVAGGSLAQLQSYIGSVGNINFNVAYDANGTLPAFGNDAGNSFAFDNYSLTVVPEPSTLALAGLGAMVLLFRRRR